MESFVAQKFQHVYKFEMHVYLQFCSFNLKFWYMAANRHTHASCNVVTLVWGSLRLAPMSSGSGSDGITTELESM